MHSVLGSPEKQMFNTIFQGFVSKLFQLTSAGTITFPKFHGALTNNQRNQVKFELVHTHSRDYILSAT